MQCLLFNNSIFIYSTLIRIKSTGKCDPRSIHSAIYVCIMFILVIKDHLIQFWRIFLLNVQFIFDNNNNVYNNKEYFLQRSDVVVIVAMSIAPLLRTRSSPLSSIGSYYDYV